MNRKSRPTTISLLLGTALVLLAVGCGGGEAVSLGPVGNTTQTTSPGTTTTTTTGSPEGPLMLPLQVWLARSDGLVPVSRATTVRFAVARAAITALLAGPTAN